jgi:uncharacterized membrane protein
MFSTAHLHPMIVHFPIALILAGFLADVASLVFRRYTALATTGFLLMLAGTLGAIAAYAAGQLFTAEPTQGEIVAVFTRHETAALVTVIVMVIASIVRSYAVVKDKDQGTLRWTYLCLGLLGAAAVAYTGSLGGTMVYSYMMSI